MWLRATTNGAVPVSIGWVKESVQDDGQRGIVKTLNCLSANDNVAFDYAVAA